MPCIIDQSHPQSHTKFNYWTSLCGKTIFSQNNPFESVDKAISSGKPICKACRKVAGLPPAKAKPKKEYTPCKMYKVGWGSVSVLNVVGETDTGYRLDSGKFEPKNIKVDDLYWRRAGSESCNVYFFSNEEDAIAMAMLQLKQRKDYLQKLIDEVVEQECLLREKDFKSQDVNE